MKKNCRIVVWVLIGIVSGLAILTAYVKLFFPVDYMPIIKKYGKEYEVDVSLVLAIINTESRFDKSAVSKKGAVGLMQLMPATAEFVASTLGEAFDKKSLFNEETNIKYGIYYLHYLFCKYNEVNDVLFCYNAGEGVYLNFINENNGTFDKDKIEIKETKNYINKVNRDRQVYEYLI